MMEHYVMGFMFSLDGTQVALIHKLRPEWQMGLWNGIGGHIESGETPEEAMIREFIEETGVETAWGHTLTFVCPGGTVYVFRAGGPLELLKTTTDEEVRAFPINTLPKKIMGNLRWIIPLQQARIQFPLAIHQWGLGID